VKPYYAFENRNSEYELSLLTSLCTITDRTLLAIISFGSLALISIIWMHLTPPTHLAIVQTLQALASIATIASIGWTLFAGRPTATASAVAGSGYLLKSLCLTLACGMLIGSLSPGLADMSTLLCSVPGALLCRQQIKGGNSVAVRQEAPEQEAPTSEDYLFAHMSK